MVIGSKRRALKPALRGSAQFVGGGVARHFHAGGMF
jgi:hypothetical protein